MKIGNDRWRQIVKSLVICGAMALAGCCAVEQGEEARDEYVAYLREVIADAKKSPDFFIGHALTDSEEQCKREMVYLDDRYLSYRIEEYCYNGGANGSSKVTVGTLDRETG